MAGDEGATDDVGGGDGSGAVSWDLRVKLLEGSRGGNAVSVVKGVAIITDGFDDTAPMFSNRRRWSRRRILHV